MATLYQRGKTWWLDYRVGGRRVQRSLKTSQQKVAEDALKLIEGDLVRGDLGIAVRDTPLDKAIERFIEHQKIAGGREGRGVSATWLKAQNGVLDRLAAHTNITRLRMLTAEHVGGYLGERAPETKGAGLAREWAVIRTFLRWCVSFR